MNGDDSEDTSNLEPYWMFDMRKKKEWPSEQKTKYELYKTHMRIGAVQKPDLVMDIAYTCPKQSSQKKRVIMVEIDGEDKTAQTERTDTNLNKAEFKNHPAKLALKVMQSTSVEAVLQPHTYNIRSNFYWYLKDQVDQSLFRTTNVETPSFQDILNRLGSSLSARENGLDDFHQLTKTIHVVWHMYRAHVKIAFLIYMREVHDIDIRDGLSGKRAGGTGRGTKPGDRMLDHHFFVNFVAAEMPSEIRFEHESQTAVRDYLGKKLMLQSRVRIKAFDVLESKWFDAPIMQTTSRRSNMTDWKARVSSGPLPLFPKEDSSSVPIVCATVQRVDIQGLCEIVKNAADRAFVKYDESRTPRGTR
jgi:hypothetical protein